MRETVLKQGDDHTIAVRIRTELELVRPIDVLNLAQTIKDVQLTPDDVRTIVIKDTPWAAERKVWPAPWSSGFGNVAVELTTNDPIVHERIVTMLLVKIFYFSNVVRIDLPNEFHT